MYLAALLSSSSNSSTLNDVEPGLLGFLVVAGIGVVLVFLLRSMNKQFKKLGPPPDESAEKATGPDDDRGFDTGEHGIGAAVDDTPAKGARRR
jgi:hypothetical protein